jgi:hypothetical protein
MSSWGLPVRTVPDSLLGQRAVEILRQAVARAALRAEYRRVSPNPAATVAGFGAGPTPQGAAAPQSV